MLLDRIGLKKEAKTIVKNAKVNAYLFTLVYLGITLIIGGIDTYVSGGIAASFARHGLEVPMWVPQPQFPSIVVGFVGVVVWLLGILLEAGYVVYHQGIRQGREMGYGSLLDGFAFAGKIILLNLVMSIFVFLWSLLFVIPGIIAAYRYRFAIYNLCENPEMGVMDAIGMSKEQTKGFKWQLFVLDLSFIGWAILCGLTMGILTIWVNPWIQQTDIGFFQAIKNYKHIGFRTEESSGDGEFHPTDF